MIPPRRGLVVRPVPGRGEVRRRPRPLRLRRRAKPPFVVGANCAIFGTPCGGGHPSYRSVAPPLPHKTRFAGLLWGAPIGCAEKRKRLLMVSREKTLAAAFRASPGTPFPAFHGGFGGADLSAWTTHPHMQFCRLGALPDAPCSSFAAAVRWLRKTGNVGGKSLRIPGCGSEKRTAGHPGGTPAFATAICG